MILVSACFRRETKWIEPRPEARVVRTAMGAAAVADLERVLLGDEPVTAVLSTGFCAGLDPGLETGDLFLPTSIRHRGETIFVDPALVERAAAALEARGRPPRTGLCESVFSVLDSAEKRRLFADGAIAADMESGPIARWAGRNAIPLLVCRAVLDPADTAVPFPEGRPLWLSALRHPVATADLARRSTSGGRPVGEGVGALLDLLEGSR
jgi:nucleoside phosphorylase